VTQQTQTSATEAQPRGEAVIEAKDIVAGYLPGVNILTGCSLVAYPGEMIGIIGPNGAGKSTLLKAMFGLVRVHSGQVTLHGKDITNLKANRLVEIGVGCSCGPRSSAYASRPCGTSSRSCTTAATSGRAPSPVVSASRWPWPVP
jgi:ABC-type transporter Mla maintaining outer membrane lipid asymmetry ATPase subunit MlaF